MQTKIWQNQPAPYRAPLEKKIISPMKTITLQYSVVFFPRYMMDFKLKPTKHYKSMEERVWTSLSAFSKSVDELSKGFSWEETCWPLGFWKKKFSCHIVAMSEKPHDRTTQCTVSKVRFCEIDICTGYSFWDRLRNFLHKFTFCS